MGNSPKISIITVVYNNDKFIENCIMSVLNQDYNNIEYIVVDGKSEDNTFEIISKYQSKISKIISEKDNGIYDAINKGILASSGDVIGILNSDDIFQDDNVLSRVAESFLNTNAKIVYSDVNFVSKDNSNYVIRHYSSKYFNKYLFRFGFQPAHPTFYAYKFLFEKYGMYKIDFRIAGDFELLLRFLYINNIEHAYINDTWVKMTVGGASTSGFGSIFKLNSEILKACTINGVWTSNILVYSKYLVKWWGFVFNKNR